MVLVRIPVSTMRRCLARNRQHPHARARFRGRIVPAGKNEYQFMYAS